MQENELKIRLRREIDRSGPISFARFMEEALYAPGLGYYERQTEIGRRGDFFTSVSVGTVFGELLAFQFAAWLDELEPGIPLQIVEAGGHSGTLADDIIQWMGTFRPDLLKRLQYHLIEPSLTRQAWQREKLGARVNQIQWVTGIGELNQVNGIIFSNELLDAFPVHRLVWDAEIKDWLELRVTVDKSDFAWETAVLTPDLKSRAAEIPPELGAVLPHHFSIEICPAATAWWQAAARALNKGKLVTIDYGLTAIERLSPERSGGTLRTYCKHRQGGSLLENIGGQDITAHVDFSALEEIGRQTGLATISLLRQSKFLTELLQKTHDHPDRFKPWTSERIKQFQTLTHPEHLGQAFRVLVQG